MILARTSTPRPRVCLVNPPRTHETLYTLRDEICFQDVKYVPFPMRLGQVGGILDTFCDVVAIDANAEGLSWEQLEHRLPEADIYVAKSAAGLIARDLEVFRRVRRKFGPGPKTILIESVVSPIYPERFLGDFPEVDVAIRGQPEIVVPQVVRNLDRLDSVNGIAFRKDGKVVATGPQKPTELDLEDQPFMAYRLFPMERYSISYLDGPMHERIVKGIRFRSTRDCPYACPFCIIGSSVWRGYDRRMKYVPGIKAVDEIEHAIETYGIQGVFFWDETFTIDPKRAELICDEIVRRKLDFVWRCLTRIDCITPRLAEKMARAGCAMIEFGIEAGDPDARRQHHKAFGNDVAINTVNMVRSFGIRVNCDLIVGMPWDDPDKIQKSVDLACRLDADNIHLTVAFPYPSTELHEMVTQEKLLVVDDLYPSMLEERVRVRTDEPVLRTRTLSAQELARAWRRARRDIDRHYLTRNLLGRPYEYKSVLENALYDRRLFPLAARGVRLALRRALG